MAKALNARLESLIALMGKSDEHAERGFTLLAQREDAAAYFDAVRAACLLDPSHNPGPREVPDKPGFVRIPYWRALDYLITLARQSDRDHDFGVAGKVLDVVRTVTAARQADGSAVDNHYTFWKFAEILGLVPPESLSDEIIGLVPWWLNSKYDRSLAGHAISDGVMKRLLASDAAADLSRACMLLRACTAFDWGEDGDAGELRPAIDAFWLRDMFTKHIATFGTNAGPEAAQVLLDRVRAVFGDKTKRPYNSSLWRPAIENHEQNYEWRNAENAFIEGLRDVLLQWCDTGDAAAHDAVAALLVDPLEILKRIALHVIDERFELFQDLVDVAIAPAFFTAPYRHELYRLLSRHYAAMSVPQKDAVIVAIRAISLPKTGQKRALYRKHIQREWASAIRQKDYAPADTLFAELDGTADLGTLSEHPDFLSFHETRLGPGPSPFTAEMLVEAAKDGTLLEKIDSFEEGGAWRGPTEEGLWSMLQSAVATAPDVFLAKLDVYVAARIPVVHAVIEGLRRVLHPAVGTEPLVARAKLWPAFLDFLEELLAHPGFWAEEGPEPKNLIARRSWVLSSIADTLASGTRTDKTAYAPRLLPQGWRILHVLLARAPGITAFRDSEIMGQAINTPRGRSIEAMVNHALRVCRLQSHQTKSHEKSWAGVQGAFDEQLALCKNANFEFSTLMAHYIANVDYLSPAWLEANFDALFDKNYPDNYRAALAGLPYATLTRRVYRLLADHGIILTALDDTAASEREAHRIVQFMCLALLWGDEDLASERFAKLFATGREEQLMAASDWFWGARGDRLTAKQRTAILAFWRQSLIWVGQQPQAPKRLLSHLARLAVHITDFDAEAIQLLDPVAPYAGTDFNFQIVIEELGRLAPQNPAEASRLLGLSLAVTRPNYDMDDRLKKLLHYLADQGQRPAVLEYVNQLTNSLPGMLEFFDELSHPVAE